MPLTKLNSLAIPPDTIVESDLSYPLTNFSSTGIDDNATSTAVTISSTSKATIDNFSQEAGLVLRRDSTGASSGAAIVLGTNLNDYGVALYGTADGGFLAARTTDITSDNPSGSGFGELLRLNQGGAALGGNFTVASGANSAYSLQVSSTYGALVSGDNGGRGLFGTNVTTDVNNIPVIANTHGAYGGIGLSCSWGVASIVRKGGAVTAGDTLDTVVRFDNDGLKFGSDTAAANALDDYEEGSWTPVFTGTTSGTLNGTGSYTKVGRMVTVKLNLYTAIPANTLVGNVYVTGFPFAATGTFQYGLLHIRAAATGGQGADDSPWALLNSTTLRLHEPQQMGGTAAYQSQAPTYPATNITQNNISAVIIDWNFTYYTS
jgi:hypothetical protein